MSKLAGYIRSSWEEAVSKEPRCIAQFERRCQEFLENEPKVRLIAKILLPEGVRPTAPNVRIHLFSEIRAKRNWKRFGTFADRRLLALLYGTSDTQTISPAYFWSYTHPYWKSSFASQ